MATSRPLLLGLVALSLVLAGCTKGDDEDGETPTPTPTTPTPTPTGPAPTTPPPTTPPGNGTGSSPPRPAVVVEDGGAIGPAPFEKTWTLSVPAVGAKNGEVYFNLTGSQPGAPPTARVHLRFTDTAGTVLKTATLGVGGAATVAWTFTGTELATPGDYKILATAEPQQAGAIPSVGLANYVLHASITY